MPMEFATGTIMGGVVHTSENSEIIQSFEGLGNKRQKVTAQDLTWKN